MLVHQEVRENGFFFFPSFRGKILRFPLSTLKKEITRDEQWELLNRLEQLYYQGLLVPMESGYYLSPEDFYELDEETRCGLPLPTTLAQIGMEENGNVGSKDYRISWYVLIHGRNAGKSRRLGCIAMAAGKQFLLTREQFRLIREIEEWKDDAKFESRARFQARCKFLAQRACVSVDHFTENRDFYFADRVDMGIAHDPGKKVQIVPELQGVPQEISDKIGKNLQSITSVQKPNGKKAHVFVPRDVESKYQQIMQIPEIIGTDIPRFVDNPLQFLPEEVTFDAELFSQRVKGLKLRKANAAPRIQIEENENGDWFSFAFDYRVTEDSDDELDDDHIITDNPELQKLMRDAADKNEEYIYYQDRWIKINPRDYLEFDDSVKKLQQQYPDGQIPRRELAKILDIYQNLEGVEYNEALQEFQASGYISSVVIPKSLDAQLWEHQKIGYQFLRNHYDSKTGMLLADDMGLGKTIQVISLLAYMKDKGELAPALLVMPLSLINNWRSEIKRFLPSAGQIYIHQGAQRIRYAHIIRQFDIVMTTYETLARDQTLLGAIRWSCVICDEAQKVKNFNTLSANAIKGMNTACRIALTGTPVENRLSELWSIVDFVQPGLLGSYRVFKQKYELPIQKHGENHLELVNKLVEQLSPIFLRRVKEEILAEKLPPKTEVVQALEINAAQKSLYSTLIDEMARSDENIALATIQKLLMVCSHPRLVTKQTLQSGTAKQLQTESPKLLWTVQKLKEIKKKREKAIIFTRYLGMQAILRQTIFEEFGINAPIINGDAKGDRKSIVDDFEKMNGFAVMILSPKAAGVGLNIVAANHVIHYTREWNPAVENQATDRAYRIGQTKPVTVYYPVVRSDRFVSVEERLNDLLLQKRELMKSVIIPTNLEIKMQNFYDLLT